MSSTLRVRIVVLEWLLQYHIRGHDIRPPNDPIEAFRNDRVIQQADPEFIEQCVQHMTRLLNPRDHDRLDWF